MSSDRRVNDRKRMLRRGRIVFRNGYSIIDCIILDMSGEGARLKVSDWRNVPPAFALNLENDVTRHAEVRFRRLEVVGVRFTRTPAA